MIRNILLHVNNNWKCKDAAPVSILFVRYMGMKSRPNDPHVKYAQQHEMDDLHGKILYSPKFGNSYYDALEYDRLLSKQKPDPNQQTDMQKIKLPQPNREDDLIKLLPKHKK